MTLILGCLTRDAVYLASDRRLVDSAGRIRDDESNKAVLVEGRLAFGYTGLAQIRGERTDLWLAKTIASGPTKEMASVVERVRVEASAQFRLGPLPADQKRHAFLGVGWFQLTGEDWLSPGIIWVENAFDGTRWLSAARDDFRTTAFFPTELRGGYFIRSVGFEPSMGERGAIARLIKHSVRSRGSTPKRVVYALKLVMRWIASRHALIGRGFQVVCLPRAAVLGCRRGALFAGPADDDFTTFESIAANGSEVQYGPHVVSQGICLSDVMFGPVGTDPTPPRTR